MDQPGASGEGGVKMVPPVVWTKDRVRALGLTTDVETAAEILGIGRTFAYSLLRCDRFPVRVMRYTAQESARRTGRIRVPVDDLLAYLSGTSDEVPDEAGTSPGAACR